VTDPRRRLPSVERLLREADLAPLLAAHPRAVVVRAVREVLAAARRAEGVAGLDPGDWGEAVARAVERAVAPTLRRCVNATGVVLHTNLGRAPLPPAALEAIASVAGGYGSLEFDIETGRRGSRHVHCAALLGELTGAEDALVVNNAASALLLALAVAAEGGAVVVSRGELIEIGGGFRIPEILEKSGARLLEVGTTNRTRLADYARALREARRTWPDRAEAGPRTRRRATAARRGGAARVRPALALLKVHRSNFRLEGFTAEVAAEELVALGRAQRVPVLYDLGGGLMLDLSDAGLAGEPTVPGAVASGAAAVIYSGDKLLGGPQAGVLVGRRRFVAACRAHPLARAVRADKLTLAALAATLHLYRDPARARAEIPVLRMLTVSPIELESVARALAEMLPPAARPEVVRTRAAVGGGAFPGVTLASRGVALAPEGIAAADLARRLRTQRESVVPTIHEGRVVLDVRTLLPDEPRVAAAAVAAALDRG
jgi:L-seryl-tRNA(Ser) seleniumtransferase